MLTPTGEDDEVGYRFFASVDRIMVSHRRQVIGAAGFVALVALALTTFVKFDFNPLDLRSARTESVSTIQDLMKDKQTSPNTIDVLAPNLAAARTLAEKLSAMPVVGQAITLNDFVPPDQDKKLALIGDADNLLI